MSGIHSSNSGILLFSLQKELPGSLTVDCHAKICGNMKLVGAKVTFSLSYILLALFGFCFGWEETSLSGQHHNHNEGHTRKVRRLQRLLLHNNRHTMQFRTEEQGNVGALYYTIKGIIHILYLTSDIIHRDCWSKNNMQRVIQQGSTQGTDM